jgi:HEAT repeat protein
MIDKIANSSTDEPGENYMNAVRDMIVGSTEPGNDPQVRQYAALLLGQLKESEGIDPLLRALRDNDKKVRAQAAKALGEIGDRSVDSLNLLMDDMDWKVRYRAAEALGIIRSIKSIPVLIRALDDPKDHVRYMAAKAIGETGSGQAESALISRISDGNEFVRRSVATALGKTGGIAAKVALKDSLSYEPSEDVRLVMRNSLLLIEKPCE